MDIILKNAAVADEDAPEGLVDIAIEGERIVAVEANIGAEAGEVIDCEGRLVSPSLIDPHVHLDAALSVAAARPNQTGTLLEGIAIWSEFVPKLTKEDIKHRARQAIDWEVAQGVGFIRTHVDSCDERMIGLEAMLEVKDEVRDRADIQIVAFPQNCICSFPNGEALLRRALDMGADVVGGIPHNETTRDAGVASMRLVFAEADERGLLVDVHCDETDDSASRFAEVMAEETIKRGLGSRITASHCVAMHSYENAYALKLIGWLQRAGLNVIANPFDNLILQAREDTYPKRRGITRVKELLQAGVNVSFGHDSIMDPWYPLGRGDMLETASLGLHACQMSGVAEIDACFDMISWRAAKTLSLDDYGVRPGANADLVVFDGYSKAEVLRLGPARTHVFKRGKLVAQTEPARSEVMGEPVSFRPAT
jgi:cytosine deaminase